jgi:hypothetical protein
VKVVRVQNALQAAFAAHRDFFLQRSCRKDDDDTYVVLLHSMDREAREKHNFRATPGNVEGRIASMGFTVAPLKPAYRLKHGDRLMDSHECLVTLVLSADIGGWLGAHSPMRYCFPFWSDLENSWLQRLLMTLVALGNKVRCCVLCVLCMIRASALRSLIDVVVTMLLFHSSDFGCSWLPLRSYLGSYPSFAFQNCN